MSHCVCWYLSAFFPAVVIHSLMYLCSSWKTEPRTAFSLDSCYRHKQTLTAICRWFYQHKGFITSLKWCWRGANDHQQKEGLEQEHKRAKGRRLPWDQAINGRYQRGCWEPLVFLWGLIFWVGADIGSQQRHSGMKCIFNREKTFTHLQFQTLQNEFAKLMSDL